MYESEGEEKKPSATKVSEKSSGQRRRRETREEAEKGARPGRTGSSSSRLGLSCLDQTAPGPTGEAFKERASSAASCSV